MHTQEADEAEETRPVLFFDGVCGLCNRLVDGALRQDQSRNLRYAPLQGETAKARLSASLTESLDTLVFVDDRGIATRSKAVLRLLETLGGIWRLSAVFRLIPTPLLDALYNLVARNRTRWFGQRETCRLPTPDEAEQFLP